jgi:hypothetical protein
MDWFQSRSRPHCSIRGRSLRERNGSRYSVNCRILVRVHRVRCRRPSEYLAVKYRQSLNRLLGRAALSRIATETLRVASGIQITDLGDVMNWRGRVGIRLSGFEVGYSP